MIIYLSILLVIVRSTHAWSPILPSSAILSRAGSWQQTRLYARESDKDQPERTAGVATTTQRDWQDEDAGAGVVGAQFFGGNKQKEEFYDPVAEAEASKLAFQAPVATTFDRFQDRTAFDSDRAAEIASAYQDLLNLAVSDVMVETTSTPMIPSSMKWESPFSSDKHSPFEAIKEAAKFFRRFDVAITSATTLSGQSYRLCWEIGFAWPTFWEPAVILTGSSTVDLVQTVITKQVDVLDNKDLLGNLISQILPRFWDVYHIGMTPTSEISPVWERRQGLIQNFVLYDVPARWRWVPTLVDRGDREDANASFLPNHAFTTAIRTMGPNKDAYIPATPTQIDIQPSADGPNMVAWKIPLTVQLQAQKGWPLFQEGNEEGPVASQDASGSYVWEPARRVATLPTGIARPQDEGVTELRKRLYERVTAAGLKPKLDESGRPRFFFWSSTTKSCFTEQGLGMAVYEWRPKLAQSNHVGVEIEGTPELNGS